MARSELEELHLADLHALAERHGVEGYRVMRRRELIDRLAEADTDELAVVEGTLLTDADPEPVVLGAGGPEEGDEGEDSPRSTRSAAYSSSPASATASSASPASRRARATSTSRRRRFAAASFAPATRSPAPPASPAGASAIARLSTSTPSTASSRSARCARSFDDLAPTLPERRIPLDRVADDVLIRAVDLLAPLALGQRVLVRSAPRSGRTTLLRGIARRCRGRLTPG